mgnify:CR=1 FL=1
MDAVNAGHPDFCRLPHACLGRYPALFTSIPQPAISAGLRRGPERDHQLRQTHDAPNAVDDRQRICPKRRPMSTMDANCPPDFRATDPFLPDTCPSLRALLCSKYVAQLVAYLWLF